MIRYRISLPFLWVLAAQLAVMSHCSGEKQQDLSKHLVVRDSGGNNVSPDGYVPYPTKDSLGHPYENRYCGLTSLVINDREFEEHCGPNSKTNWPCFTHIAGNLDYVIIEPWLEPIDMAKEIVVKDGFGAGR